MVVLGSCGGGGGEAQVWKGWVRSGGCNGGAVGVGKEKGQLCRLKRSLCRLGEMGDREFREGHDWSDAASGRAVCGCQSAFRIVSFGKNTCRKPTPGPLPDSPLYCLFVRQPKRLPVCQASHQPPCRVDPLLSIHSCTCADLVCAHLCCESAAGLGRLDRPLLLSASYTVDFHRNNNNFYPFR
eukprot:351323-Chlamydomonas_euryale.AAC.19